MGDVTEIDEAAPERARRLGPLHVGAAEAGWRLDRFLAERTELSRSRAAALIRDGRVALDRRTIGAPDHRVKPGETFEVDLPPPAPARPRGERIALDIAYEDDHLIVLDKPAGLVVHPGAGRAEGTLVNALIAHCGDSLSGIGGVRRPGIVHRLDKLTSGLMVVAKTDRAHQGLAAQFADHGRTGPLERGYKALVWGAPRPPRGVIEAALGRAARNREKIEVKRAGGRAAVTEYRLAEAYGEGPAAALVECRLRTGRTHQIRVHMAHIGHPLIGDSAYGAGFATKARRLPERVRAVVAGFARQALHAWLLGFRHPVTGEAMRFESPLPADMAALREALRTL